MRTKIATVLKRGSLMTSLGLMCVAAYWALGTRPANACNVCECVDAGLCYSNGDCYNDMVCSCTGDCSDCRWIRHCPPKHRG